MSIEQGDKFLPESTRLVDVFSQTMGMHSKVRDNIKNLREFQNEDLAPLMGDLFTTGVAYFANRGHDRYMQTVGTTTWKAVNQKRVLPALVEDAREAAIQLGVPRHIVFDVPFRQGEPFVLFGENREGKVIMEFAYVLMPAEFIDLAHSKPIAALATMAWICSQVRDMANGRLSIDGPNINSRAKATEAHFLIHALAENPALQLNSWYSNVLKEYPEGIDSLPDGMRYKGKSF